MVDMKEAFDWISKDTPELGDIAERAIEKGRRRKRLIRWIVPGAGVAAMASTLSLVLVLGLAHKEGVELNLRSPRPAAGDTWAISLSEEAPKPLSTARIGAVDLAFQLNCGEYAPRGEDDCQQWRLWREGGASWRITDVAPWTDPRVIGMPPALLSPRGDRIAYVRASDKATIVRNLVTGEVRKVVKGGSVLPAAWSPNGRWLALHGDLGQDTNPTSYNTRARVVDTTTWKVVDLPRAGLISSVPDAGEPVPVRDHEFEVTKLWKLDGTLIGQVKAPPASGIFGGAISPDGRTIVAGGESLLVYNLEEAKVVGEHRLANAAQNFPAWGMNWFDKNTLVGIDYINSFETTSHIYGIDVRSGKIRTLIEFPGAKPRGTVSLATARR